jgi:hypothetical protein
LSQHFPGVSLGPVDDLEAWQLDEMADIVREQIKALKKA